MVRKAAHPASAAPEDAQSGAFAVFLAKNAH